MMMSKVLDEQTKLRAAALNTVATSSFTVGILAPIGATFYNVNGQVGIPVNTLAIGVAIWFFAAIALHLAANFVLKGLSDE